MREHHAAGMAAAADAIPKVRVTSRQRLVMHQGRATLASPNIRREAAVHPVAGRDSGRVKNALPCL